MESVIITEGNKEIGFGHVTRCSSLYQAFESLGVSPRLVINGDETIQEIIKETNNQIFNWIEEPLKLFNILNNVDIIIIDSYKADIDVYQEISEINKVTLYIDDNKRLDYPSGIVVNGSTNASRLNYPSHENSTYLTGTNFIPLQRVFWEVPNKIVKEQIKTVLITFGGDDFRQMTPRILKLLDYNFPELHKRVVVGKGFKNLEELNKLDYKNTELIYYPNASEMLELMQNSDLAISAAGQTIYELARLGVPTITITVASNQDFNAKNSHEVGFVKYAGAWDDQNLEENIQKYLEELRSKKNRAKMSKIAKNCVDGQGAIRIAKHCIKSFLNHKPPKLRIAKIEDSLKVLSLSNDPEVRLNSFNQEIINIEDHEKWFQNKIHDHNCLFLVAESGQEFIGQIRFELNQEAVVSISISKPFRGLGMARKLLKESLHYFRSEFPLCEKLTALIKEDNIKSLKLFESCGFRFEEKTTINNVKALKLVLDSDV